MEKRERDVLDLNQDPDDQDEAGSQRCRPGLVIIFEWIEPRGPAPGGPRPQAICHQERVNPQQGKQDQAWDEEIREG